MPIQKFYRAKKPTFQLRVLDCLAFNGWMTKIEVTEKIHASYPDVSEAIKLLKERGLIERKVRFPKRGRARKHYKLSQDGFQAFLTEEHTPKQFWAAMITLCKFQIGISKHELQRNLDFFIKRYLGEDIYDEYSFYSNFYFFDIIFKQYWEANKKKSYAEVPLSQKILEFLAFNPMVTKKEIATAINISQQEVTAFLVESCVGSYASMEFLHTSTDRETVLEGYRKLLGHSLIVPSFAHNQNPRYELSLFGVMLVLGVVRTERSFNFFNRENKKTTFYNIDLQGFFERIAKNYGHKLPLVFRKWQKLKSIIDSSLLPLLFNPLFYKEERPAYFSLPIPEGGNKEIYDSIKGISIITTRKLFEIFKEGTSAIASLNLSNEKRKRLIPTINSILGDLEIRLSYADVELFLKNLNLEHLSKRSITSFNQILHEYLKKIEIIFAREITFIFYSSLIRDESYDRQWTHERELYVRSMGGNHFISAKDMLLGVMRHDQDIQRLVCKWIRDANYYQSQVLGHLQILNNELC